MNIRLTIAFVLGVFLPGIGYELLKLPISGIATLYGFLGYVVLTAYLVATGYGSR